MVEECLTVEAGLAGIGARMGVEVLPYLFQASRM
jgi:hypothetical protein